MVELVLDRSTEQVWCDFDGDAIQFEKCNRLKVFKRGSRRTGLAGFERF